MFIDKFIVKLGLGFFFWENTNIDIHKMYHVILCP